MVHKKGKRRKRICLNKLGYQVPECLKEREKALDFLTDTGIASPKQHIGKLFSLLHYMRTKPYRNKNKSNNDRWVSINTTYIKDKFGDKKYYYMIMNSLIELGYVERYEEDGKQPYQKGFSSKQYRLSHTLHEQEWSVQTIMACDCSTTRKMIVYFQGKWKSIDYDLYHMLKQIQIDDIAFFEDTTALNFFESKDSLLQYFEVSARKKMRECDKDNSDLFKQKMIDLYVSYKSAYLELKSDTRRHDPDMYGRRHTNITNLPKIFRQHKLYATVDGVDKRFDEEVDIKNSQVLLLLTILPKRLNDYDRFKELVETGMFYDHLAGLIGRDIKTEREYVKEGFFTWVFGDPKEFYVWNSEVFKAMKRAFPSIVKYLDEYKSDTCYQKPSREMQKMESKIMIDYVCVKASAMGLLFTQVFDSILCFKEDAHIFNDLIKKGFEVKGLKVTTNIDRRDSDKEPPRQ